MKKAITIILSIILTLAISLPAAAAASVPVKRVKLDNSKITLRVKQTYLLKTTFSPANTTQKTLTYSTANKNIATVDRTGKITGVAKGSTVITVSTPNRKVFAQCAVTVADTTVRIGYMPGPSSSSALAIASKKGYLAEVGIKADGKKFLTGPEEFQAMQAGDLDIINIGPGATRLAAQGQGIIIMLDCLGMSDYIVTYKGSGVNSIKDLKGKVVGVSKGTSAEMVLNLALKKEKMSQKDLKDGNGANIAATGIVSAMIAKQVDAVATWTTYGEAIKGQIGANNFVVLASDKDFYPDYVFPGSWVVRPKFLKEHPDVVADLLKAFVKANDFRSKNREETCKICSAFDGSDLTANYIQYDNTKWFNSSELKKNYMDGNIDDWYVNIQNMFVQVGTMDQVVPTKKFVDTKTILGAF